MKTNVALLEDKSNDQILKPEFEDDKGMIRVFVYGTLKRGHGNNALLNRAKAVFMGADTITGPFRMLSLGGCPGVVDSPENINGATTIFGELWAGDEEMLAALDMLEGHPRFYERKKFRTDLMDKRAWMYTLGWDWAKSSSKYNTIKEGIWHPTEAEIALWKARGVIE